MGAAEDVEPAVGIEGEPDRRLGRIHVRDVADDGDRLAARRLDLVDDGIHARGVHAHAAFDIGACVGDDDLRAFLGIGLRDPRAHAARAAGDDGDLTFEVLRCHICLLAFSTQSPAGAAAGVAGGVDAEGTASRSRRQPPGGPSSPPSVATICSSSSNSLSVSHSGVSE